MISPLLLASVLGTFSNAQYITFEDFYNDLSHEEQIAMQEEQIDSFVDFDQYILENYSTEPNRNAPNPYVYHTNGYYFVSGYYPEYSWQLADLYELSHVSGHQPVSIGSDSFPESDVVSALAGTTVENSTYGGCGPRAIIGILDYYARYLGYSEFMANPNLSTDRIALAHSVFESVANLDFNWVPNVGGTFVGPLSYKACIDSVIYNNSLSSILKTNMNLNTSYGQKDYYLNMIIDNIQHGTPTTIGTFNANYNNSFAKHYFNVFGIETWVGTNPLTNEVMTKKLLICKANFTNNNTIQYYLDYDLLDVPYFVLYSYRIDFDEEYVTNAQSYSSFVNANGGGQYFYYEKYGSISLDEYKSISFNRLRCSYILNQYLVLSPKRIDAGIAHLYLNPSTIRSHYLRFDAALWSDYEEIENQSFFVEYYGSDAQWHHLIDYDLNVFSTNRDYKLSFNVLCPRDAHGIRFKTIQPNPSGTCNRGRIVLDNIKISGNL